MDNLDQLTAQARALLSNPAASLQELNTVYKCLTGTVCRQANRIRFKLDAFVKNPEAYRRRVEEYYISQNMSNDKRHYRFSAKATGTVIIVHDKNGSTVKVTPETLTDERAELVLGYKQFAHNIERIPEEKKAKKPEPKAEPAAAVAEAPAKKSRSKKK